MHGKSTSYAFVLGSPCFFGVFFAGGLKHKAKSVTALKNKKKLLLQDCNLPIKIVTIYVCSDIHEDIRFRKPELFYCIISTHVYNTHEQYIRHLPMFYIGYFHGCNGAFKNSLLTTIKTSCMQW